jgi:nitroreductase
MDSRLGFIFKRRSIRAYTSQAVAEDDVSALLEAAMAAPSAANKKPWHFVVVTDRKVLDALAEAHPYGSMLSQATLAVAVCADPGVSEAYWVQDCSAATENLLVAVSTLGLGAVWLGCHPRDERKSAVRRVLGIPESIEVLSLVSVGHPDEEKPARTQYDASRVHWQGW